MNDLIKRGIIAVIRPPLVALRFVIGKLYYTFFSWDEKRLIKKGNEEFVRQVREHLSFLFTEYGGQIMPNEREPPPYFDFAAVTIAAGGLCFLFTRDRGAVHVAIAPGYRANEWYDLHDLLRLIDGRDTDFSRLPTIARLLRSYTPQLQEVLSSDRYQRTRESLAEIREQGTEQTRRFEAALNRNLYRP